MFLDNKYTKIYFQIIESAKSNIKKTHDGQHTHHIVPRSLGGSNKPENLVVLSYKQHRVCHRLLTKMTTGEARYKMMYAFKLFESRYPAPSPQIYCTPESYKKMAATRKRRGSYRTGSENVFASPKVVAIVKERMTKNNPMKSPQQRDRMRLKNSNPHSKPVIVEGTTYPTLASAARAYNTTPHLLKRDYSVTR